MSILGIVGGIAPGSTIEYYRLLVERYRALRPDGSYPSIVIDCIDLQGYLALMATNDRNAIVATLVAELERLARAGADFALFASNTPHLVFDDLAARSPLHLLSIVEASGRGAAARGVKKAGLLGTRFTMEGGFYEKVFARYGVAVVVPDAGDLAYVHDRYVGELVHGEFRLETRRGIEDVVARMRARDGIDAVILGGTELPLLLPGPEAGGVATLDTTRIHVEEAVARLIA